MDLVCLVVFTCSATYQYRLHSEDENQDYYLLGGISASIGIGLSLGFTFEDSLVGILPWGIMLSLLASSLVHASARAPVAFCYSDSV